MSSIALGIAALVTGCYDDPAFGVADDSESGAYVVSADLAHRPHADPRNATASEERLVRLTCVLVGCSCAAPPAIRTVAPSGRSVLALRHGRLYVGPSKASLRLVASDSWGPVWSTNGKKLAFVHGGEIWVVSSDGARLIQLTHPPFSHQDGCPAWLPGDRALAFRRWGETALP